MEHNYVLLCGNWRKKGRLIIDGDSFRSLSFPLSHSRGCCCSISSFLPLPYPHPLLFSPPLPPPSFFLPCLCSDLGSSLSICSFLSPLLPLLPCSCWSLTSLACTKRIHNPSIFPHFTPSCFLYLGVLCLSARPKQTKRILIVSAYLSICASCKEGSPLLWTMDRVSSPNLDYLVQTPALLVDAKQDQRLNHISEVLSTCFPFCHPYPHRSANSLSSCPKLTGFLFFAAAESHAAKTHHHS